MLINAFTFLCLLPKKSISLFTYRLVSSHDSDQKECFPIMYQSIYVYFLFVMTEVGFYINNCVLFFFPLHFFPHNLS